MITIRKSEERGHFDHGWLDTYHTFSFADYFDPQLMGFRALRVINEDRVEPGMGFGTHGHKDMEIVTYVLDGALAHRDSMGNSGTIRPGEVQRMSAGTGVMHSEYNASRDEPVHLLQIWILPDTKSIKPSYEQKTVPLRNGLTLIGSRDARDGAVRIQQDVELYAGVVEPAKEMRYELRPGRHAWIQVARGSMAVNGHRLDQGDGAALSDERELRFEGDGEFLLFDLG